MNAPAAAAAPDVFYLSDRRNWWAYTAVMVVLGVVSLVTGSYFIGLVMTAMGIGLVWTAPNIRLELDGHSLRFRAGFPMFVLPIVPIASIESVEEVSFADIRWLGSRWVTPFPFIGRGLALRRNDRPGIRALWSRTVLFRVEEPEVLLARLAALGVPVRRGEVAVEST